MASSKARSKNRSASGKGGRPAAGASGGRPAAGAGSNGNSHPLYFTAGLDNNFDELFGVISAQ